MFNDGHKSPCMGCDKRQVGCHSTCETYIAYKAEIEAQNEERRQKAKLLEDLRALDYKRTQDFKKGLKGRRKR